MRAQPVPCPNKAPPTPTPAHAPQTHAHQQDDEVFERMRREADGGDVWGNEIIATVLKVRSGVIAFFPGGPRGGGVGLKRGWA